MVEEWSEVGVYREIEGEREHSGLEKALLVLNLAAVLVISMILNGQDGFWIPKCKVQVLFVRNWAPHRTLKGMRIVNLSMDFPNSCSSFKIGV